MLVFLKSVPIVRTSANMAYSKSEKESNQKKKKQSPLSLPKLYLATATKKFYFFIAPLYRVEI